MSKQLSSPRQIAERNPATSTTKSTGSDGTVKEAPDCDSDRVKEKEADHYEEHGKDYDPIL